MPEVLATISGREAFRDAMQMEIIGPGLLIITLCAFIIYKRMNRRK